MSAALVASRILSAVVGVMTPPGVELVENVDSVDVSENPIAVLPWDELFVFAAVPFIGRFRAG